MEFDGIEDLAQLDDTPPLLVSGIHPSTANVQAVRRHCARAAHPFLMAPLNVSPRSWM